MLPLNTELKTEQEAAIQDYAAEWDFEATMLTGRRREGGRKERQIWGDRYGGERWKGGGGGGGGEGEADMEGRRKVGEVDMEKGRWGGGGGR